MNRLILISLFMVYAIAGSQIANAQATDPENGTLRNEVSELKEAVDRLSSTQPSFVLAPSTDKEFVSSKSYSPWGFSYFNWTTQTCVKRVLA